MSAEVRTKARNTAGSYLVQAPAGSGKTELLTQRILAILAIVDEPEDILALTFTRKAAAEMRGRVIEALRMGRPDDGASHKMETWRLAQEALKRSDERGWSLFEHPARLRIMTLDSLMNTLARQLPLLSGLGEMPRPVENAAPACRDAAEAALNEALKTFPDVAEAVLLHQDHNAVALIRLIAAMLTKREQWLKEIASHARDMAGLRSTLEANLANIMARQIAACDALMPLEVQSTLPALARFAGTNLDNAELEQINGWPAGDLDGLRTWKLLANFLLVGSGPRFRKSVNKGQGFPTTAADEKSAMQDVLDMLSGIPGLAESLHGLRGLPESPAFAEQQWRVLESLFTLLILANKHLQQVFSLRGEADFPEINLRALNALADMQGLPSDLLLKLDYRIHHILVDEFQDTSGLQMRLLHCLTAGWQEGDGRHRTLFMVGDPMQSIYRFRKAEVGLFLQAADNMAALPHVEALQLERNFRSAPAIVAWANAAFGAIFPSEQDVVRGAVAYATATAALSHKGCVQLHIQTGRDDALEAERVVELVRSELAKASQGDAPSRIGILARSRKHLHAIMPALQAASVPFRAINILPLDARPEIRVLRALVRALLHPADRESWTSILRSPCCGLTTADMFTLMAKEQRSIWELLQDENILKALDAEPRARVQHVRQALAPCMLASGKTAVRELVESAWLRLAMPQLVDATSSLNIDAALNLIEELDEGGRINFSLFDERLEQLFAAADAAPEASRVELLTMHGAKGLQWDAVLLPGLGKTSGNTDAPVLAFTDAPIEGASALLIAPRAPSGGKDALYVLVQGIEKSKADHEQARLLYVACTRAETSLHMLGHVSEKDGKAGKGSLLGLLLSQGDDCFGADIQPVEPAEQSEPVRRQPLTRIKTIPPPCPALVADDARVEPEYGWAGPEAAPVGNAVHAALQAVAEHGIDAWNEEQTRQLGQHMQRLLVAEGLSGGLLANALARCREGLRNTLGSKRGRWLLSGGHADGRCEWALSMHADGQTSHAVLDRSFIDAEGARWIVDYKTASHEGGDMERFLDEEEKRHSPQLQRYARLLKHKEPERTIRLGLYFPILDAWREIELAQC
ncbi:MAG: UvrD-helicase domain-containing protein [Mariprofundaceae bacterium]